jgi:hypothetical protein
MKKSFISGKGILHLVFMYCCLYAINYYLHGTYVQHTLLFPSSMLASLSQQVFGVQLFFNLFFAFCVGYLIEWCQAKCFKAEFSWFDVMWTSFGIIGFFHYQFYVDYDLYLGCIITASALVVYIIYDYFFKPKTKF